MPLHLILYVLCAAFPIHAQPARGGGGLGAFSAVTGGMTLGSAPVPMVHYTGNSTLGDGPSAVSQHRLNGSVPVYVNEGDSYALLLSASNLHFGDALVLRDAGTAVPRNFQKIEAGAQFSRKLADERGWGMRFSAGSASDKPFATGREITYGANAYYSFPGSETSHWVLTLFVSNNNPIANYVPIPGFIYFYRSGGFTGMFGLPFAAIAWVPAHPWTLSLSLFGPTLNSEAAYGPRGQFQTFAGFYWTQQSFLRHGRSFTEDRVYFNEMKTAAGVRAPLSEKLSGEFQAGFAFNRVVYEGPRFRSRERGAADLDDAWYAQWNLKYLL